MLAYEEIFAQQPFALLQAEREVIWAKWLRDLTHHHRECCLPYRHILESLAIAVDSLSVNTVPFLPVRLFKDMELMSVERDEASKLITSSGTSGQAVSRIFLDRETAANQQKALVKIVSEFFGIGRLPMLIIDSPAVVKDRQSFSARGAGILGFSIFGADRTYALTESMQLDVVAVQNFLARHKGKRILLFGFTFMVWQHFYKELAKCPEAIDLSKGLLLHGGGWKHLANEAVSPQLFKDKLSELCGIRAVHDYYGMAEQTGSIYLECNHGHLHSSIFSDVIMRRAVDFKPCLIGEPGIIQVISLLPRSYPGHSLLTEDWGTILGIDDCPCGRKGKYFKVHGRLAAAEIRGCSDTYAADG